MSSPPSAPPSDPSLLGPVLFMDHLYRQLLERGLRYFFPGATMEPVGPSPERTPSLRCTTAPPGDTGAPGLLLDWLGSRYRFARPSPTPFSAAELELVASIGAVLAARYQIVFDPSASARTFHIFRGLPEDRYVSAFLEPQTYRSAEALSTQPDRIADAIEVLRLSALTTYENRRIEAGALLFGLSPDPCHPLPAMPEGALRYDSSLTYMKTFFRVCDGARTVALVNPEGRMIDIVDVQTWADSYAHFPLPAPPGAIHEPHARATACGGHVCLILTPNGEIKIFSGGVETFRFLDGRWRLTNAPAVYELWKDSLDRPALAERLFGICRDLAESRRGALFVVVDDPAAANAFLRPEDHLSYCPAETTAARDSDPVRLHYLFRGRRILDLPRGVLESLANIDGAIVLDADSHLLTFGAILRVDAFPTGGPRPEGGRTNAAIGASHFGHVLKVSQDGVVSCYRHGRQLWEL